MRSSRRSRGLQCRELAAAKLPDGEPERRAPEDSVPMAEVGRLRRELEEMPAAYPARGSLPAKRRGWDLNPRRPAKGAAVFKTAPFDRSGTPPWAQGIRLSRPLRRPRLRARSTVHLSDGASSGTAPS